MFLPTPRSAGRKPGPVVLTGRAAPPQQRHHLPKSIVAPFVSVITPSFQQGPFIERTLESVRLQNQGDLAGRIEHIVMDGGSTDGTVEILERWRHRITFRSGPDGGQTAAINAGLAMAGGEILAYLNSDDVYYAGAVAAAVEVFAGDPSIDVVYGDGHHIDADDRVIGAYPTEGWALERLKKTCFLCQPAVFFRRGVLEHFGPFDASLGYCMDYEYWLRLGLGGARFAHLPMTLAGSRLHRDTKTGLRQVEVHAEINGMLKGRLGVVPDTWLWSYAHALLDRRGIRPGASPAYFPCAALLTIGAALQWNGVPPWSLLRLAGARLLGRSSSPRHLIAPACRRTAATPR
ncbi:MAG: putative glycosyltransferase [Acidobacteria bacterium]|nr:putative glycosyltransferase [Acidobacteriota bacterium]